MSTIETTTISPPSNYPHDGWAEDAGDYFFVSEHLRRWYASPEAAPNRRQTERLHENIPMPGGGRETVDKIVTDGEGRFVKADPIQLGQAESRGLLGPWRAVMVEVDPYAGPDTMPLKTWEHDIRMANATKSADMAQMREAMYRENLARACPICGTANPAPAPIGGAVIRVPEGWGWHSFRGQAFCNDCLPAVQYAATVRHYQQYQAGIDRWVNVHIGEYRPNPPQRH